MQAQTELVIGVIAVVGSGLVFYVLGAIAFATLLFLWFPRLAGGASSFIASLIAPLALVATIAIFMIVEPPNDMGSAVAALLVLLAPAFVAGLPSAILTRRALDKRIVRAGASAQEVFE